MSIFNIIAILLTLAAIFSYLNYRYIKLPTTIGLMFFAMVLSLLFIVIGKLGFGVENFAKYFLNNIDFDETVLNGMLCFLLFAGSLHVNLEDLSKQKWIISLLATIGVTISTILIGFGSFFIFNLLGLKTPLILCFLFGALISPTDPIAVLSILKKANVPKGLETKITGESLFNDGVAFVIFIVILQIATTNTNVTVSGFALLFIQEAIGGIVFGLIIGAIAYYLLKSVDNYQVEILITLALVTGGYALASYLHISGPIATVVCGLLIGNKGRLFAMSDKTRQNLDTFWELTDDILNAILFLLIGLELLIVTFTVKFLFASLLMIPFLLIVRFVSVGIPITIMRRFRSFSPNVIKILTWGGLRGGLSIAMALSLPESLNRNVLIAVTYVVVAFSIIVQGLTIEKFIKRTNPKS